mgnify:CR=1 FL=1
MTNPARNHYGQRPSSTRYVVLNEHTLGYLSGSMVGVLRSSVLRGAPYTLEPGLVPLPRDPAAMRDATLKDFEDFRVAVPSDFGSAEPGCTAQEIQSGT